MRNFLIITILLILLGFLSIYYVAFYPNASKNFNLKIPTGSKYNDLMRILKENKVLKNYKTFDIISHKKNLINHINPGNYKIIKGMSNNSLINKLRSGNQDPVKLIIRSGIYTEELVKSVSMQIETDSTYLKKLLLSDSVAKKYNFTKDNFMAMFLPNTYYFYWNTDAQKFLYRMNYEYNKFWNAERRKKAIETGLNTTDIVILASIIEKETSKTDEMPRIAGLYINRLNKKMPLQADPTIKFAASDPSLNRILFKHLKIESPYNTYKNLGLPPGPICLPSIKAIESVLNYERHNFLYFCAKEDFSGYHNFASSYQQHLRNRLLYLRSLNSNKR